MPVSCHVFPGVTWQLSGTGRVCMPVSCHVFPVLPSSPVLLHKPTHPVFHTPNDTRHDMSWLQYAATRRQRAAMACLFLTGAVLIAAAARLSYANVEPQRAKAA
ncbi:hypothetical protein D1007_15334 [Hordeum vulgare]|nr:hypothetical protein D1007_15334 [Hordeum vulgare]